MNTIETLSGQEKGTPCISIIVPIPTATRSRMYDELLIEKAVQQAKADVNNQLQDHPEFTTAIDELYRQIDFIHPKKGIGLFISPNVRKMQYFHFPVKKQFDISNSFLLKDLLYEAYYETPYQVLLLSEKEVKVFKGSLDVLAEVNDDRFPLRYEEEYLYNRPARGSLHAGYANTKDVEKDKSQMEEIRAEQFFRKADHLLGSYLSADTPLVVAGAAKNIAWFHGISKHTKNIVCNIPGNYLFYSDKELDIRVWNAIKQYLDNKKEELVKEYIEKTGEKTGVEGAPAVWKAVNQGRGYKLLVEKDLRLRGYVVGDGSGLQLDPPTEPHQVLEDVVEPIVRMVLEKNGEVMVMDNGQLNGHSQMALITRY